MTLSYIFFGTNKRDPAEHTCPWLNITPESAPESREINQHPAR